MIGMTFQAAKGSFFDREKVKRSVDAGTRRVLSKFGAFVRQRARTSIRKRKGTSPTGSPPYSHVGLLRKFILFAYDPQRRSVVIGPTLTKEGSQAPRLLEHGGDAVLKEGGKARHVRYRPRPFMQPALEAEKPKLPALWRDSVR
ncbi:MAG TPA: hypothetical protein VNN10_14440 [Dehalococcoidia bacterium]|uniref:Uncharacterized protein n=1 Tax=Isosphaera pallida (strain ATCC 43644 / DSM 9630 / IS1B) TaxID=575540 RepID=E8QWV4_ISOPI|nr:hypothetical protein [Isosphaera pallida]ADV63004.1 hypothetical protein Isop_2430 [Isosphaera pallida ATCC 43644]MCX7801157.1 hypothetical protein [Fimbriimonadales bacterium]HXH23220.1 hypothetical protein [Dehalococcoidia bacterium]